MFKSCRKLTCKTNSHITMKFLLSLSSSSGNIIFIESEGLSTLSQNTSSFIFWLEFKWTVDSYLFSWTSCTFLLLKDRRSLYQLNRNLSNTKSKVTQDVPIAQHLHCHALLTHQLIMFQVRLRPEQPLRGSQHPGAANKERGQVWRLHCRQEA